MLFNAGFLQARSGSEVIPRGKLDQKNIPTIEFRDETNTLTTVQLIKLRALFKTLGLNTQTNYESVDASKFLERLAKLADDAGGEPPLPKRPGTSDLDDLANRVGNDQLKAILDLSEQLTKEIGDWQKRKKKIEERQPHWTTLKALLTHAADLPTGAEVQPEVDAIEQNRGLLKDPDPVPGLLEKTTEALRQAITDAWKNRSKKTWASPFSSPLMFAPTQETNPDSRFARSVSIATSSLSLVRSLDS